MPELKQSRIGAATDTLIAVSAGIEAFRHETVTASRCMSAMLTYLPPPIGSPVKGAGSLLPRGFGAHRRSYGYIDLGDPVRGCAGNLC